MSHVIPGNAGYYGDKVSSWGHRGMGYFRSRRSVWAVGLALFSLSLLTAIPLIQALAAGRTADDGVSNRIWVCAFYGLKLVDSATGKEVPPEEGGSADCPTCMAYAIGMASLANASEPVLRVPMWIKARSIDFVYTSWLGSEIPSAYLTRAPPLSV
jgi:hypothetical protein